jgi:hypothetical protein
MIAETAMGVGTGEAIGISAIASSAILGAFSMASKFLGKKPTNVCGLRREDLPCDKHGEAIAGLKATVDGYEKWLSRIDEKLDRALEKKADG